MKKYQGILGMGLTALSLSMAAGQVPFTAGNLVVLQDGTDGGAVALPNLAVPTYLKEIRIADGAVIQTIALPFVASATGNRAVNHRGTSTSEGFLARSQDTHFLTFGGHNVDVGLATTTAGINRVVGRVTAAGVVDTTTELTDGSYSGDSIRSVYTTDGTAMWTAGTTSTAANGGVRYTTFGSNSATLLNNNTTAAGNNTRVVKIFNGQLYVSAMAGTFRGINGVGTGIPTTGPNPLNLLPGFDQTATSPQDAYDFFYLDANTLYLADNRAPGTNAGGIQKWVYDSGFGTWSIAYTLNTGLTTGCRGMTAVVNAGVPTFYATTATANASAGNAIVTVTDTGAASSFSTVATCGANTWFKGVDFAPIASGPAPCYANCDASTSVPLLTANDFQCFLNEFAAGNSYANCDGSTNSPVLTANDFQCFLNAFAVGCT